MKVLKYGMVFILPVLFALGLTTGSWLTFGPVIFAFVFIPLVELFFQPNPENISQAEVEMRKDDKSYDLLLYAVLPVLFLSIAAYLFFITTYSYSSFELVGLTFSLGVML
ncbi:MAG TPA: hypothetical protein VJ949_01255, partial [Cryomorphaceae bacterium]|nr:hypothetical protein [Cryomorphaceae bacterium]